MPKKWPKSCASVWLRAERAEALPIGVIAVDAIFTPVRKVNYWVEAMRVGQMTNYDKLTIEIETDGTITPEEALSRSAEILVNQFRPFVTIGSAALPGDVASGAIPQASERPANQNGIGLQHAGELVRRQLPPGMRHVKQNVKHGRESAVAFHETIHVT